MSAIGSATESRTSPLSRGSAQAEAALPACSIMRARFSAKRSGSLTRYCSTPELGSAAGFARLGCLGHDQRVVLPWAFS